MYISFNELKRKITISEVAESIGYVYNRSAGTKYLEYKLYNGSDKLDEVVIYTNKDYQTFFSRNGIGDKGNLINFVLNRLHYFTNYEGSGYAAVRSVLLTYIGADVHVANRPLHNPVEVKQNATFDLGDYLVDKNYKVLYSYLCKTRCIDKKTVDAFIRIGSINTVSKKSNPKIINVAFPFRDWSTNSIVNFEMRNYNKFTGKTFKGFCSGGNKASACWIGMFSSNRKNVKNVYIGESALDMIALYQLLKPEQRMDSAFISIGGNLVFTQISSLRESFPNAHITLAYDDDPQGHIYDVESAIMLQEGQSIKAYRNNSDIVIEDSNLSEKIPIESFDSKEFLTRHNMLPTWIEIIKAPGAKDFNDVLLTQKKDSKNESIAVSL